MRIVSLVPNATEILFALGAGDDVVGVSHECDYPPEARTRPILTGSALHAGHDAERGRRRGLGAARLRREPLHAGREAPGRARARSPLHPGALPRLRRLDRAGRRRGRAARPERCPEILSLDPTRLEDVLADILHVGERIGRSAAAEALVDEPARRGSSASSARPAAALDPTVVALEWLDPPFLGGHWVPQMIAIAGGRDPFAVAPGERSRRATWEEIAAADPDWIVAMPCGFDAAGAAGEVAKLAGDPQSGQRLRAVRSGRVAAVDANGCFSRPGPRLVDGIEQLHRLLSGGAPASA